MRSRSYFRGVVFCLLALWVFAGCSDDDDATQGMARYVVQIRDFSTQYGINIDLQNDVDSILERTNTSKGYFEADADGVYNVWEQLRETFVNTDWGNRNYLIADATWVDVVLLERKGSGGETAQLQQRRITFPYVVYQFRTAAESANYALNYTVRKEVAHILSSFNDEGQSTFFTTRGEALVRLQRTADSLLSHNWKRNDYGVLPNTYFNLQLIGGNAADEQMGLWPVYGEAYVKLPNY